MKPKLIVMVGIQGSGKSTQAKILAEQYKQTWGNTSGPYGDFGGSAMTRMDAPIVSTDQIRKELGITDNEAVFKEAYYRINLYLRRGSNCVIFDATNITLKHRRRIFDNIKEECEKIAYVMNVPYETCVERVKSRNDSKEGSIVLLENVEKYWKSFQCPAAFEGFDDVILHDNIADHGIDKSMYINLFNDMLNFDQDNPNHSFSLGEHSLKVNEYLLEELNVDLDDDNYENDLSEETKNLIWGSDLHDVGKLLTKVPNKKDPSYSSYYNHAETGGYFKMCNGWTPEEVKYETYHMHLYQFKTEKAHEKWKNIFGEEMYNNLMILNKCDIKAH